MFNKKKKSAFTISELVAALVIIAVIVVVTLPVTVKKFKKVDYASHYMGYKLMQELSANVIPKLFKQGQDEDKECVLELEDGTCFTSSPMIAEPLTPAECGEKKGELGIDSCCNDSGCIQYGDYWAGAVSACGGLHNMPSSAQLEALQAKISNELAADPFVSDILQKVAAGMQISNEDLIKLMQLQLQKYGEYNFLTSGNFVAVWSNTYDSLSAGCVSFWEDFGTTGIVCPTAGRNGSGWQTICVKGNQEKDYTKLLCQSMEQTFNNQKSDCSVPVTSVETAAAGENFKNLTPHIELANGLKFYIGSDYEDIEILSDAEEENDRSGFLVYIDVDGNSGKAKLNEDVVAYYLLRSGKILPAPQVPKTNEVLKTNVLYDVYSGDKRDIKMLLTDSDYKMAVCTTGYIKSVKYCGTTVQDEICKDAVNDCRIIVKEPVKLF